MKDLESKTGNSCYNYNTTTDSIRLEVQIENEVEKFFNTPLPIEFNNEPFEDTIKRGLIAIVKSDVVKEYWQQGMYTQEQMLSFADFIYSDYEDSHLSLNELFIEWIEKNKKK